MSLERSLRYDPVAVALHWATALLIMLMIPFGLLLGELPASVKFDGYALHKSIGLVVLALGVFRLIWRFMNPPPALPESMPASTRFLAHSAHWMLYFLIIAMPLSGWIMISATAKYPTVFFWLGEAPFLPMPTGIDKHEVHEQFETYHLYLAYGAIALIVLHIGAALQHHFILKDGITARMLPRFCQKKGTPNV